jgi:hypothetical protein
VSDSIKVLIADAQAQGIEIVPLATGDRFLNALDSGTVEKCRERTAENPIRRLAQVLPNILARLSYNEIRLAQYE